MNIANDVSERKISAAKDGVQKLHLLHQELHLKLINVQKGMTFYYNAYHVSKQFKIGDFIKLFIKYFKLKHSKLSLRWIESFHVLKQIRSQAYELALPNKYAHLHPVFFIQMLEDYHCHDDTELAIMPMSDLENAQNEGIVEEVCNKQRIKSTIHYLIKGANWPSEYNSYELVSHLTGVSKAVADYERKLKCKRDSK